MAQQHLVTLHHTVLQFCGSCFDVARIISLSSPLSLFGQLLERCIAVSYLIGTISDGRCLAEELHHGKRGEPWHSSFTVNNSEPELLSSVLTH